MRARALARAARRAVPLLLLVPLSGCGAPEPAAPAAGPPLAWPNPLPPAAPEVPTLNKGLAVGTWAPDAAGDFTQSWLDEAALRKVMTNDPAGRRVWRGFTAAPGAVPLDALLGQRTGEEVAYLYSLVQRASALVADYPDVPAVLHVRHRGRVRAWFDGRMVLDEPPADGARAETRAHVVLTGPFDVLLLKCGRGSPALGGSLDVEVRLSAPDGTPLPGTHWNSMRPGDLPTDL